MDGRERGRRKISNIILIVFLMMAAICSAFLLYYVYIYSPDNSGNQCQETMEVCKTWRVQDKNGEDPVVTPGTFASGEESVTIYRWVDPGEFGGKVLLFHNNRQAVTVKARGKVLYQINTTMQAKKLLVTGDNLVYLPASDTPYKVELTISHFKKGRCILPEISIGSSYAANLALIKRDFFTVVNIILLIVVGIVIILLSAFFIIRGVMDMRLIYLAFFVMIVAAWAFTDSSLVALTNFDTELAGFCSYITFMAMPIPIAAFVWDGCHKKYRVFTVLSILFCTNIIVQTLLSFSELISLHQMLFMTHILIALMIGFSIYYTRKEMKENPKRRSIGYLYGGFVMLSVVTVLSVFLYWLGMGGYYRHFMLSGIFFFYVDLMAIIILSYIEINHENSLKLEKLKIYEEISLTDNLTGLGNRRAFERKLSEIEEKIEPYQDAVMIMLDLNGLKHTNDTYGHAAGDELILAAANCIRTVYGQYGNCYRIGGDEFTVILFDVKENTEIFSRQLQAYMLEYNQKDIPYKLSMAKGESRLLLPSGEHRSFGSWKQDADIHMYEDKTRKYQDQIRNGEGYFYRED